MAKYITTRDLRAVLKVHGQLWLGTETIGKLVRGELRKEQPDIQWLYDCAMERGNSAGVFDRDPLRLRFTNAGTCTLGVICEVRFCNTSLPIRVLAKYADDQPVWPEDMDGVEPASVEISYEEFLDEEGDDE